MRRERSKGTRAGTRIEGGRTERRKRYRKEKGARENEQEEQREKGRLTERRREERGKKVERWKGGRDIG